MTREEAIKRLREYAQYSYGIWHNDEEDTKAFDMAIEALHREEAEEKGWCHRIRPSNVEVVVRCKDCRWWNGNPETMHNNHLCRNWSKFGSINTGADDFCSYGERRENEHKV